MSNRQAFVVMQIGAKDSHERKRADEIFDFIVKPALADHEIKPYRADLDPTPGGITPKMLSELLSSDLVIADLTGRNPNVFYELGIAHSFARPLITIADSVRSLPFDAKDERVIELGNWAETGLTYAQGEIAKRSLLASLDVVLRAEFVPPSPLRELAGVQSLDALAPTNPLASEIGQIRESIESIRDLVSASTPLESTGVVDSDVQSFRNFVEALLAAGYQDLDIMDLIDLNTSVTHDVWVRGIERKYGGKNVRNEAFGGPSVGVPANPWATVEPIEEPPF